MLDPLKWGWALQMLEALEDKSWVNAAVLDYWLSRRWLDLGKPLGRYITIDWMMLRRSPTPEEVQRFRKLYNLPLTGSHLLEPFMGLVQYGGNHYFVLYYDPHLNIFHALGQGYTKNEMIRNTTNWQDWGIDWLWSGIFKLHGWEISYELDWINVNCVNWVQNGYDCGPIACRVLEHIWLHGFHTTEEDIWTKPPLPACYHRTRLQIANEIHLYSLSSFRLYDDTLVTNPALLHQINSRPDPDLIQRILNNPESLVHKTATNLQHASNKCTTCQIFTQNQKQGGGASKKQKVVESCTALLGAKIAKSLVTEEGVTIEEGENNNTIDDDDSKEPTSTSLLKPVKDWTMARLGRFPRPSPPTMPRLINLRGLWSTFTEDFDNYEGGPTIDILKPIPDTVLPLGEVNLVYFANRVQMSSWTMYKDYGWRLLPSYAEAFHHRPPVMLLEHLMPIGLSHPPSPILIDPTKDHTDGLCVMGPSEMLERAELEGNDNIFLTGKTRDGTYIHLDLRCDAVEPEAITTTCDIDSLVWVTQKPRFSNAINIYSSPQIRNHAPISKHNHIYVDVLAPQTEDDSLALGARSEWIEKRFRLSQLPHLFFGKLGDGSGVMNVYLFFPRMAHQHEWTRRWRSIAPADIQSQFWSSILIPATLQITDETYHPYISLGQRQQEFKSGVRGRLGGSSTIPFRSQLLPRLVDAMRELVCDEQRYICYC